MSTVFGEIDKKYTLTTKIGSGGTSKVYLAKKNENPKEQYAVKVIKPTNNSESKVFMNEINVLKNIKHPNVVRLIDGGEGILTKETGKKHAIQYLVLELVKYGELFDYIFFPQKGFGEDIGKYILTQLIDGLEAVHKSGIVHRDMKTENIMLGENWQMKIADFGFSTKAEGKKKNGLLYTALGTASYAAPELLQKKPYLGVQSDIFSLGVSMFVLVTGKMPFKHALVDDPYYKEIVKGDYDKYWTKLETKVPAVSKEFKNLFVKLISYDPNLRPSLDDCKKSDWMKEYKPDMNKINSEFTARSKVVQEKKEIEKKKEELEKHNGDFKQYKEGETVVCEDDTLNDLDIRLMDEDAVNPYTIRFPNESKPGELQDYIFNQITSQLKVVEFKKLEGVYKFAVGCRVENEEEVILAGESLQDTVEALAEVKKYQDGLVVEFSRELGSKYDFHYLFEAISNSLLKK